MALRYNKTNLPIKFSSNGVLEGKSIDLTGYTRSQLRKLIGDKTITLGKPGQKVVAKQKVTYVRQNGTYILKNLPKVWGKYMLIGKVGISLLKTKTQAQLRKKIITALEDYHTDGADREIYISRPHKVARSDRPSYPTRLGTGTGNCFIKQIQSHIDQETYDKYINEEFIDLETVTMICKKFGFNVMLDDCLGFPWWECIVNGRRKTFKLTVNKDHCLSKTPTYKYTDDIKTKEKEASLVHYSSGGFPVKIIDLSQEHPIEWRDRAMYDGDNNYIVTYYKDLTETLPKDNEYTKNLNIFYLSSLSLKENDDSLHSYDRSGHFYNHQHPYFSWFHAPNQHKNNASVDYLQYTGFVHLKSFTLLEPRLSILFNVNGDYPSWFIRYALDKHLIKNITFDISYNETVNDTDILHYFNDKDMTKEAKKLTYVTAIGMLKESKRTAVKQAYYKIKTDSLAEVQHFSSSNEFMMGREEDQHHVFMKKKHTPKQFTHNAAWMYIIYGALMNLLDAAIPILDQITLIYADAIRTAHPIECPEGFKYEGLKDSFNMTQSTPKYETRYFPDQKTMKYTLVRGIGGTGKSYEYVKTPLIDSCISCPTHELIKEHKAKNSLVRLTTHHCMFGINTPRVSEYASTIIIDEVGMISSDVFHKYIRTYLRDHEEVNCIFIYGENQLAAVDSSGDVLNEIMKLNPVVIHKTVNHRIQDPVLKEKVDVMHSTKDIVEQIKLFSDQMITREELKESYRKGDLVLASKKKIRDELKQFKASTFHSSQGKTANKQLFIIASELFDKSMFPMGITRAKSLDQIKIVIGDQILTKWDYFLTMQDRNKSDPKLEQYLQQINALKQQIKTLNKKTYTHIPRRQARDEKVKRLRQKINDIKLLTVAEDPHEEFARLLDVPEYWVPYTDICNRYQMLLDSFITVEDVDIDISNYI